MRISLDASDCPVAGRIGTGRACFRRFGRHVRSLRAEIGKNQTRPCSEKKERDHENRDVQSRSQALLAATVYPIG